MKLSHVRSMVYARTMEFVRDRGTFIWNLVVPLLLVFGFAFAFSDDDGEILTIAVYESVTPADGEASDDPWRSLPAVAYRSYQDRQQAVEQVATHQADLLVDTLSDTYLVNPTSPGGRLAEQLLQSTPGHAFVRAEISGDPIRYIDWFVPGVIGINMMFSSLFGVGFVIVRYRKNGVLKRLQATPLSALDFVTAQVISRLMIVVVTSSFVYAGANFFLNFMMRGSYLLLLLTLILAIMTLISFGLLFAARFRSEEVASGVLNLVTFPMLIFSGAFFSLDEAPPALQIGSRIFPLTHFLEATRAIMLDGAGFLQVAPNLLVLAAMTVVFLVAAALLFRWN